MSTTIVHLTGPAARGVRVKAPMLRDLLDTLLDAVQESVRLLADGRSRAAGPAPSWLGKAAAFDVEVQAGSTQLVLDAQPLGDLVPDKFAQADMFRPLDPTATAVEVFTHALEDALAGRGDSDRFDEGLLETLSRLGRVLDHGVAAVEFRNGRTVVFDRRSVETLRQVRKSIPAEQQVRIAGKLDLLKHSSRVFAIVQGNIETRGVVAYDADFTELGRMLGQRVLVLGTASFRPSGKLLRVEAEEISPAVGDTTVWEAVPQPLFSAADSRSFRVSQGPRTGVAAIFGAWPDEEDDSLFEDAVRALS